MTVQLSGGPHWNLAREGESTVRVTSVALDATIGYGFRFTNDGRDIRRDGWLVGLGLSLRRYQVTDPHIKYFPWSRRDGGLAAVRSGAQ